MKTKLCFLIICLSAPFCLAQSVPPPPPGSSHEEAKKWTKKMEKKEQKMRAKESNSAVNAITPLAEVATPTVTPERLTPAQSKMEATTSDGKRVLLKSDGTWDWFASPITETTKPKDEQKISVTNAKIETIEKVTVFFDDYIGQTIKLNSVYIGALKAVPGTNNKTYGVTVQANDKTFYKEFMKIQDLNFTVDETLARQIFTEQEAVNKMAETNPLIKANSSRGVNLYIEINTNDGYKIAAVRCIEYINQSNRVTKTTGDCK
jgi:hypothetical protein